MHYIIRILCNLTLCFTLFCWQSSLLNTICSRSLPGVNMSAAAAAAYGVPGQAGGPGTTASQQLTNQQVLSVSYITANLYCIYMIHIR